MIIILHDVMIIRTVASVTQCSSEKNEFVYAKRSPEGCMNLFVLNSCLGELCNIQ